MKFIVFIIILIILTAMRWTYLVEEAPCNELSFMKRSDLPVRCVKEYPESVLIKQGEE